MVQTSYPGVYIEEISSGVRTIKGVATSITAFVGWTIQGPTDEAVRVLSWADYERLFGGLRRESDLSYAVYHFFANGGQDAYIVRIVADDAAFATATAGDLELVATGQGKWAGAYLVDVVARADDEDRFRLSISYRPETAPPNVKARLMEVFENLSMDPADPRYVVTIVNELSQFVNAEEVEPGASFSEVQETRLTDGADGTPLKPGDDAFRAAIRLAEGDAPPGALDRLEKIDLFNILCIPGETDTPFLNDVAFFCQQHRAFLIVDSDKEMPFAQMQDAMNTKLPTGIPARNAAFYYPYLRLQDPMMQGRLRDFPPCGAVAGIYARTDATRGVWKAPAGVDATVVGASGPKVVLTDNQNGVLNPKAVNCIRSFPTYGTVVWGARTARGQDEVGDEWKYVPVRRTALFVEETLFRSLKWVVFEPNDEPLWAQIRLNVGAFMHDLFRQGAFQGRSPRDAYFVKCDSETTTQNDINLGMVNIVVGFAPLRPAEFVIVKLQQMAGQIEV